MLHEISEVCDKIALINHGKIIAFDTIENLEKNLKEKELNCQLLNPIHNENLEAILHRLTEKLIPYLNDHIEKKVPEKVLKYYPDKQSFKILYDGKKESRGEILDIFISEFKSNNKIISFSQPKASKLEQIYLEMILEDEPKLTKKRR
jgi:ABC-type multidrug transport system ATPase subunit